MNRIWNLKNSLIGSALLSLLIALPAVASTKGDVKKLQAELESLKQGQEQIHNDVAEIKKLLEAAAKAPAPRPASAGSAFTPKDLEVGDSPVIGSADAAVTIFEYSDYQCPYCSRHATTVLPRLVKEYVDTGKVRIVMREYPIETIHPRAFAASAAALCAGNQGKYWEMHDKIFANQKALSEDDLKGHAETLGLDGAAYDACMTDEATEKRIRGEIAEAQSMGISGTPSFVVGPTDKKDSNKVRVTKYIRGAQPFTAFDAAIKEQLKTVSLGE